MDDEKYMALALREAERAYRADEVPVGAVIVRSGEVIARAHNMKERLNDATRHAEIVAISRAARKLGCWYLDDCVIYVTLEPCAMCAGAIINSRLKAVVFGAYDTRFGCCGSVLNLLSDTRFNHNCPVTGGIMQPECASLLTSFFKEKRQKPRIPTT